MMAWVKRRGPTTIKPSQLCPQGREPKETNRDEVEKGEEEDPLEQKFKILEQEWSFFKRINSRKSQHSVDSTVADYYVTESCPREVMSSLQRGRRLSSEGYLCKWRHNDKAVVEILRDRWDANQSGKLKGRRLFEDLSSGETEEEDVCNLEATDSEAKIRIGSMIDYRKTWLGVVIAWLGVIFAICVVVSRKFNGGYDEDVLLVPT